MKIKRTLSFLCLIFFLGLLPGCGGGKQELKSHAPKAPPLETSVDITQSPNDQNLSEIGLSSASGQAVAAKEEESAQAPAANQPEEQKQEGGAPTVEQQIEQPGQEPSIEFHFENADLEMLINQVSELFDVTFVADDSITPMLQGAKSVKGHKISFKTQRPLTKREAWDLFLTFLDLAGFAVISEPNPKLKRIVTVELARKSPLPAYIGVPPSSLPDSDEIVRYVYFVENAALETIQAVIEPLRSPSSSLAVLREMKAFVLTDKAYNIKSLMNIVKELDKVTMPQAMSVLKLRKADATDVKKLYESLAQVDEKSLAQQRFLPQKKSPASHYFPENVGIFAEPRTNSLVLLGPQDAIKRIEDFITQSVDVDLTQPYSPLHVIKLRYANATTVADIMNKVTQFGANTEAGKNGGVRGGDKYLKPIVFTPEEETNRIIVKGDYEDFLKAKQVISEIDAPQPQVAIEVLLLAVTINLQKQLGMQIRTPEPGTQGLVGASTTYQTSGLFGTSGIIENPNGTGVNRLLGNLLNLVSGAAGGVAPGNTIISLGDSLSVWAIIQALETASNIQVLANPFLIATNKTPAVVSLGEIRRVITGTIVATSDVNTYGDAPAKLELKITPQINSDGMIVLDIIISLSQFVGAANPNNTVRTLREIKTKTIVTNKEVIALGGLIQNNVEDKITKVPILGDIPILGWFFKNKSKSDTKSNLLVLISSRIIEPEAHDVVTSFTNDHITDYTDTLNEMYYPSEKRDPINRWFFGQKNLNNSATDEFLFRQQRQALEEAKLHKDVVTPIPMAENTKNAPRPMPEQKTIVATRPKRSLLETFADQEGANA